MTLNCPTCAIALSQRSLGSEMVQSCDTCNGACFESPKLSSILHETTEPTVPAPAESPETIDCPKCETKISSSIYAYDSGIPILKCSTCFGVWLVAGQLEKIIEFRSGPHKTDRLGQALVESYAQSNVLNRFAGIIQSRVLSAVFAIVILVVALYAGIGIPGILQLVVFLLIPIACIWFSDAMGNLTGIRMGLVRPAITSSTPGIAVALGGWILMFAEFGVMIYVMVGRV